MKPILLYLWLRLKRAYGEIDYAQKRLLEIKTGQVLTPESARSAKLAEVEQLNALLEVEPYNRPVHKRVRRSGPRRDPHIG